MRWLQAVVGVLSFMVMAACPSEFGKEGRVAKAARKDVKENLLIITGCADAVRERVCAPGKENSDECLRYGGP